ncbi:MAG: putative acetyltransferase [Firmicutes bacterium ADurb.BinA052]|nr:MAG: putative acetyltransferase [Firmicutes bacterium ADurb.BinA052]
MEYGIGRVSGIDMDSLVELFNDAYSDYYVDVQVNPARLRGLIEREDIQVDNSFVAYEGQLPVGVVFLGVRGKRGYICGMGVRTSRQRRGVGELLMRRALSESRRLGLSSVQLEVVAANRRAIALYSKLGFVPVRDLGLWERNTPPPAQASGSVPADHGTRTRRDDVTAPLQTEVRVGAVRMAGVLPLVDAFNEIRPCWQNEAQSLVKMSDRLVGYVSHVDSAATAYVVFGDSAGGLYVADFAAAPRLVSAQRQSMCEILLSAVDRDVPRMSAKAFNIPLQGYQEAVLRARGFDLTLAQQEMVLCLKWR